MEKEYNLDDSELAIVSLMFIERQIKEKWSSETRVELINDFALSIKKANIGAICDNLVLEIENFNNYVTSLFNGNPRLENNITNFTNIEKYICYQCELYLRFDNYDMSKRQFISGQLAVMLKLQKTEDEIMLAIRDQFNETIMFCEYWFKKKKRLNT